MKSFKKLSIITFFFSAFVLSIIFFSCSNENVNPENTLTNPEISNLIEKKMGLIELKDVKEINLIKNKSKINSNAKYYKSSSDNTFIVVSNIDNNYFLDKGKITNGKYIIENRFELVDNMDKKGNGNLIIKNLDEGVTITQTYENGVFNNIVQSPIDNSTSKLCQREAGETYGQCNSRETNDFCNDFVSTVAYITNPTIPILIAALCSC